MGHVDSGYLIVPDREVLTREVVDKLVTDLPPCDAFSNGDEKKSYLGTSVATACAQSSRALVMSQKGNVDRL